MGIEPTTYYWSQVQRLTPTPLRPNIGREHSLSAFPNHHIIGEHVPHVPRFRRLWSLPWSTLGISVPQTRSWYQQIMCVVWCVSDACSRVHQSAGRWVDETSCQRHRRLQEGQGQDSSRWRGHLGPSSWLSLSMSQTASSPILPHHWQWGGEWSEVRRRGGQVKRCTQVAWTAWQTTDSQDSTLLNYFISKLLNVPATTGWWFWNRCWNQQQIAMNQPTQPIKTNKTEAETGWLKRRHIHNKRFTKIHLFI